MEHQNWSEVVLGGKKPFRKSKRKNKQNKQQGGGQPQKQVKMGRAGQKMHKVLENDDMYEIKTVSFNFKMALQKARQAKKLTQKQLAQQINEKPLIIQMLEQGKAQPNQNIIRKLERALQCKLPRDNKKKKGGNQGYKQQKKQFKKSKRQKKY